MEVDPALRKARRESVIPADDVLYNTDHDSKISNRMGKNAGPSVLPMLRNEGENAAGLDHANQIPHGRLNKGVGARPK